MTREERWKQIFDASTAVWRAIFDRRSEAWRKLFADADRREKGNHP